MFLRFVAMENDEATVPFASAEDFQDAMKELHLDGCIDQLLGMSCFVVGTPRDFGSQMATVRQHQNIGKNVGK